jgi:hypothetical protein
MEWRVQSVWCARACVCTRVVLSPARLPARPSSSTPPRRIESDIGGDTRASEALALVEEPRGDLGGAEMKLEGQRSLAPLAGARVGSIGRFQRPDGLPRKVTTTAVFVLCTLQVLRTVCRPFRPSLAPPLPFSLPVPNTRRLWRSRAR